MYQFKAHGLLLTLVSGLFFSSQALAAAMPQSSTPTITFPPPGLTCASYANAPLIADCKAALALIKPGEKPQICTFEVKKEETIKTVGTCIIKTYSEGGKAHCLSPNDIRAGVKAIIDSCKSTQFTQGSYTWTGSGSPDGVRLIKAA